jgi:hypothetical protein
MNGDIAFISQGKHPIPTIDEYSAGESCAMDTRDDHVKDDGIEQMRVQHQQLDK